MILNMIRNLLLVTALISSVSAWALPKTVKTPTTAHHFKTRARSASLSDQIFFRSHQSGNWSDILTWEISTDGSNWSAADRIPVYSDSTITIQGGHEVHWDIMDTLTAVDDILVQQFATLTLDSLSQFKLGDEVSPEPGVLLMINSTFNINNASLYLSRSINNQGAMKISSGFVNTRDTTYGVLNNFLAGTIHKYSEGQFFFPRMNNWCLIYLEAGTFAGGRSNWSWLVNQGNGTIYDRLDATNSLTDPAQVNSGGVFRNFGFYVKQGGTSTITGIKGAVFLGRLLGTGTINFPRNIIRDIARLSPGDDQPTTHAIGQIELNISTSFPIDTLDIDLAGSSGPGVGNDLLVVNTSSTGSSALINGILNVTETSSIPEGSYTIIRSPQALSGAFSETNLPSGYTIQYFPNPTFTTLVDSVALVKSTGSVNPPPPPPIPAAFFRSLQTGPWNDPGTWEMSSDSVSWQPATRTPGFMDTTVQIRNGHLIQWLTADLADSAAVDGIVIESGGTLSIELNAMLILGLSGTGQLGMTIEPNGSLLIHGGSLIMNQVITNHGLVEVESGGLNFLGSQSGYLENMATGNVRKTTNGSGVFARLINHGTFTLESGSMNAGGYGGVWLDNDGTVIDKMDTSRSAFPGSGNISYIGQLHNAGVYKKLGGVSQVDKAQPSGDNVGLLTGFGEMIFSPSVVARFNRVDPGDTIGSLRLKVNAQIPLDTLTIQMSGTGGPGIGHDLLTLAGTNSRFGFRGVDISNGRLSVSESTPLPDGSYTIIRATTGLKGNFAATDLPPGYTVKYFNSSTTAGLIDSVILVRSTPTTPSTLFFRSRQTGSWMDPSTWESSEDSLTWQPSTRFPIYSDSTVNILAGHTVRWTPTTDTIYVDDIVIEGNGTLALDSSATMFLGMTEDSTRAGITIAPNGRLTAISNIILERRPIINAGLLTSKDLFTSYFSYIGFTFAQTAAFGLLHNTSTGTIRKSGNLSAYMLVNEGTIVVNDGMTTAGAAGPIVGFNNSGIILDSAVQSSLNGSGNLLNTGLIRKFGGSLNVGGLKSRGGLGRLKGYGSIFLSNPNMRLHRVDPADSLAEIGTFRFTTLRNIPLDTLDIQLKSGAGAGIGNDLVEGIAPNTGNNLQLSGVLNVTETGTVPDGAYTIIRSNRGFSGNFTTTNLPSGYSVHYFDNVSNIPISAIDSILLIKSTAAVKRNLTISTPAAITEGNTGQKDLKFVVRLNAASAVPVKVYYSSSDSSATAGDDYIATNGWLQFAPGQLTDTVHVLINGDKTVEPDEFIKVRLSAAVDANITTAQAIGTIRNDDNFPALAITNYTVAEGNRTDTVMKVQVRITAPYPDMVTVDYTTEDSTATAGIDYLPSNGTLIFNPGDTLAYVFVTIKGDRIVEANEIVKIRLLNAVNANLPAAPGRISITNDDTYPAVASANIAVAEGNNDQFNPVALTVRLTKAYPLPVTVRYYTQDSTATANADYQPVSGVLTFVAEDTLETVTLPVLGDRFVEPAEIIKFVLDSATNATAPATPYRITLNNDDAYPAVAVTNLSVTEGDVDTVFAAFTVRLTKKYPDPVTVQLSSSDITAIAGLDYQPVNLTLTFAADGDTIQTVTLKVLPDLIDEVNETFKLQLANPVKATLSGTGAATITITDNDPVPAIRISDTSATEASGLAQLRVNLSIASGKPVKVAFRTVEGTAKDTLDYVQIITDTLTFQPGETQKLIPVSILTDALNEPNETFTVVLSGPTNGSITAASGGRATGTVTILNSAAPSALTAPSSGLDQPHILTAKALPNPSSGPFQLRITTDRTEPIHLRVSDLSGHIVESRELKGIGQTVETGHGWSNGMYILEIEQNGQRIVQKLIKMGR